MVRSIRVMSLIKLVQDKKLVNKWLLTNNVWQQYGNILRWKLEKNWILLIWKNGTPSEMTPIANKNVFVLLFGKKYKNSQCQIFGSIFVIYYKFELKHNTFIISRLVFHFVSTQTKCFLCDVSKLMYTHSCTVSDQNI